MRCCCGDVEMRMPCKSVQRFECCCCDCYKGLRWCYEQGGPEPPVLPDLVYYPNALMLTRGRSRLRCFTIQQGFPTRRVVATCCWTALCGDHPVYAGKRFVAYQGPAILKSGQGLQPPDARIFQSDRTEDELASLPPFTPSIAPRSFAGATAKAEEAVATMKNSDGSWRERFSVWPLVTIQELIESIPTGVEVADPSHVGPTPAGLKT